MISSILYLFMGCEIQTQSHHVVGLLDGQEVYDLRIIKSDAGILAGQGHIKLHHWQRKTTPISLGGHFKPKAVSWTDQEINMGSALYSKISNKFLYVDDGLGTMGHLQSQENGSIQIQGWSTVTNRSLPISGTALEWEEEYHSISELISERYWWLIFGDTNLVVSYNPKQEICTIRNKDKFICKVKVLENTVKIEITDANGTIQNVEYQRKYFYGVEDPHQSLTSMEYTLILPPKRYIFRGFTETNARVLEIYKGNEKPKIKKGKK